MPSTQRFLANDRNVLLNAALMASSVKAITNAVLDQPRARAGSARVSLSGDFIGQEESQYEIEITDTTVNTPLISRPVFTGAGTGAISGITYAGTAQEFTIKLSDLGQILTASGTDIEGASLVARTPGASGNLTHLSVDQSGLLFQNSNFSLIEDIKAGTDGVDGPQYDWDTKVMGTDGQIPPNAHRLVLGDDTSTVYRQYKQYKGGKWLYHFEPPLKNDFSVGSRVKFVNGGRTVTISDGVVTETYPGIVTLYDLLSAIQTSSTLVKVDGVVANDRTPGGMAARDFITRTDAHSLLSSGKGSASATGFINCAVTPTASTELVEARCWAVSSKDSPDAALGRELWELKGSVSGVIDTALRTGVTLTTDKFSLAIPSKLPNGFGVQRGRFSQTGITYVSRNTTSVPPEIEPPICIGNSLVLGPGAVDQTLTLTYKAIPSTLDCSCKDMSTPDFNGSRCLTGALGLTSEGELTMIPAQMGRLDRLSVWHRDFVSDNIVMSSDTQYPRVATLDIELAGLARDALSSCLDDIYRNGTLSWSGWEATTPISRYTIIQIGDNRLQATIAGTTGSTEPLVPATVGETVVDGTVTWALLGKIPELMWDDAMDALEVDLSVYANFGESLSNLNPDAVDLFTALYGQVIPAGTLVCGSQSGLSENTKCFAQLSADLTIGSVAPPINATGYEPIGTPITVDAVAATWQGWYSYSVHGIFHDIHNVYTTSAYVPASVKDMAERYVASMDAIRAAAGIAKKSDASTVAGDGCWRDNGDPYWWEVTGSVGGEYAPAFNNAPYIASRKICPGGYFSTHEFAFQINVKCPDSLKVGDRITLSIGDSGWPSTYQVGDTLYLPIIAAQDLYLSGGQDGDNVQTWHVDGSISGALPAYLNDLDTPTPYNESGLQFQINAGGIPFEAGDLFRFTIEGGHYHWRKDGGPWSAESPIMLSPDGLSEGLSATFTTGASPSFSLGDLYSFRALQPAALSNVITPDAGGWQWSGATVTLTANLGEVRTIDCAALSFHTLPYGATVTLYGGADGAVWDWSEVLPWRSGVMAKLFSAHTATWLKFEITGANDGSIGWAWAGQALSTEYSAECLLRRDYSVERGAGLNPSAVFMGATLSGEIEWQQGILTDTDMPGLMSMLDHLKINDDEPMILIPQATRPDEAYPVRVLLDSIDMPELGGYQPDVGNERRYGLKLTVKGVVE